MSETRVGEWRAHWRIVAGTLFGMSFALPAWNYVQSQFVQPLQAAFHWSRAEIAFAFGVNFFLSFMAPVFGRLIDRVGVRPVLLPCLLIVAAAYVGLANTSGDFWIFVGFCLLLHSAGLATTGVAFTRSVISWFRLSRGAALAVSRIGLSLVGAFTPALLFQVIHRLDWRAGFYTMGALCLFIAFPASLAWIKDPPRAAKSVKGSLLEEFRHWGGLLRDWRVLAVCVAAAGTYGPSVGILTHLQPLLTSKAINPATAAGLASILAISIVAGTLITGLLVDRVWAPLIGCLFTLLPVAGLALLLTAKPGVAGASVAIAMVGLAQGAEIDVVAYVVARYFGVAAYSAIYSLTVFAIAMTASVAGVAFGWVFDRYQSYDLALMGAAAAFALAAAAYLSLGRYPEHEP